MSWVTMSDVKLQAVKGRETSLKDRYMTVN